MPSEWLLTWFLSLSSVAHHYNAFVNSLNHFNCSGAPELGVKKLTGSTNCQHYILCVNQKPFLQVCPWTTLFNPNTMECDIPQNVKSWCEPSLGETFVEPKSPRGKIVNDCSVRVCGNYPLAYGDCTQFLHCWHGKAAVRSCPGNLLFDMDTNECQSPSRSQCWVPPAGEEAYSDGNVIVGVKFYNDGVFLNDENSKLKSVKSVRGGMGQSQTAWSSPRHFLFSSKEHCPYEYKMKSKSFEQTNGGLILTSRGYSNKGEWLQWQDCPLGQYVNGLSLFRGAKQRNGIMDNAGIVSIAFQCQYPRDLGVSSTPVHILPFAAPGTSKIVLNFKKYHTCGEGGVVVGFQINSEKDQELDDEFDDMATANVRLFCSCGPSAVKPYWSDKFEKASRRHGEWLSERYCGPKQAVCGANMQFHEYVDAVNLKAHDNTGLNNIKVKCCDVPNPAGACTPIEKEILVASCINSNSDVTNTCDILVTLGTAYDYSQGESAIHFYESIGFIMDHKMRTLLSQRFNSSLGCGPGNPCLYDWANATETVWSKHDQLSQRTSVPPRTNSVFYQVIGECGHYIIHTNKFLRIDRNPVLKTFHEEYIEL